MKEMLEFFGIKALRLKVKTRSMGKNYSAISVAISLLFIFSCGTFSTSSRNKKEDETIGKSKATLEDNTIYTCNEKRFIVDGSPYEVIVYAKLIRCLIDHGSVSEIAEIIENSDYNLIGTLARREFFLENLRGEIIFQSFLDQGRNLECIADFDGNCQGSTKTVFNTKMLSSMIESIDGYKPTDFINKEFRTLEASEFSRLADECDFPTKYLFGFSVIKQAWEEDKIVLKPYDKK